MSSSPDLRRTPLHRAHIAAAARMVPFAGWEMPVQYSGVVDEHQAVRQRAGLFDVSHMGEVEIRGTAAEECLQRLTCNDVSALRDGRAQYSALLNDAGGILDDVIVYRLAVDRYLVVVNAANTASDLDWMRRHTCRGSEVVDRSAEFALMALQGPRAEAVLAALTDLNLGSLGPFRFAEGPVAGRQALVARTGYTGEDGFELMVGASEAPEVWSALLESGRPEGLVPAGLGARDTLRLEAGLLLHGSDMDAATTPLEAGLDFIVRWGAGDFLGRSALERQRTAGIERKLCGLEMVDAGIPRHGYPVWVGEVRSGEVTSGSFAPTLRRSVARAFLPAGFWEVGTEVHIEIRGRRCRARVVPTPFYRRPRR